MRLLPPQYLGAVFVFIVLNQRSGHCYELIVIFQYYHLSNISDATYWQILFSVVLTPMECTEHGEAGMKGMIL